MPRPRLFVGGLIVEIPIFASYKGASLQATLLLNPSAPKTSKILYAGQAWTPSRAGLKAKQTINLSLKNMPNGWIFWKLQDPLDGSEVPISHVRKDEALLERLARDE